VIATVATLFSTIVIPLLAAIALATTVRLRGMRVEVAASRQALATAGKALARHQALYRIITEDAACTVAGLDAAGLPIRQDTAVPSLDPTDLLTDHAAACVHPDDLPALRTALAGCGREHEATEAVCRTQQRDGRLIWIKIRCRHVPEDGGTVVLLRDVSEPMMRDEHLTEAVSRLERLALHDPLTGLLNRPGFLAAVDRMLACQPFLAVLLVDLDGFKTLNDAHGHAAGDAILRKTGDRLANAISNDAIAARLSGDEFAVVLPGDGTDVEIAATARHHRHVGQSTGWANRRRAAARRRHRTGLWQDRRRQRLPLFRDEDGRGPGCGNGTEA
jgi:diguanylate cyclase (GGDEF)-like protein